MNGRQLTGRTRFRVGMFGILIAQVEVTDEDGTRFRIATDAEWKRAEWIKEKEDNNG